MPGDYQAWMALGNCYDRIKKPHRAEKCFRAALDNAPENDREGIIFNLGNSIYEQGRYAESIELFQMISPGTDLWVKAQRNSELVKTKM